MRSTVGSSDTNIKREMILVEKFEYVMADIQDRIDEVFEELQDLTVELRSEDVYLADPDKYQEIDARATRLDGQLQELKWCRERLEKFLSNS
jgi:hypothetical protein